MKNAETPLALWLAATGRSRTWLARELGVSVALTSKWATGARSINAAYAARIEELTQGAIVVALPVKPEAPGAPDEGADETLGAAQSAA